MYLAWFDADRKKPTVQKIAEAHERYLAKFGRQPLVCLVNPEDAVEGAVVELRPLRHIGRNCFWIGADEAEEASLPEALAPLGATPPAAERPARRGRKLAAPADKMTATVATPPPTALDTAAAAVVATTAPAEAPLKRRTRRERTAA